MGEREDAEIKRRSQAMVDAQKPVRYWQRGPTVASLAERVERLEARLAELERRRA